MGTFDLYRKLQPEKVVSESFWMTTTGMFASLNCNFPADTILMIDWGDGTSNSYTGTGEGLLAQHSYQNAGTKYIRASGTGFTQLTAISCYNMNLSMLNISQNTALKKLYCQNNNLINLDISKNTELTHLACNDNTLTAIDISQNFLLSYFDCNDNSIVELNVSQNTALNYLVCNGNSMTPSAINNILSMFVAHMQTNGLCYLNDQTPSAPPTGQGITDKATLISRGWTVTTD